MFYKLHILCFITLLYQANGFSIPDLTSSEEIEGLDWDDDLSPIDESDYWDLVSVLNEKHLENDDEKWNEIDNMDWLSSEETEDQQFTQFSDVHGVMQYSIGKRVRGDTLVAHTFKNQSWPRYQNVKTNLTYPIRGQGKIVTCVEIQVNQTTNLGQAYIVRGGLKKRFITIIVEAYNTLYFNMTARFYGK